MSIAAEIVDPDETRDEAGDREAELASTVRTLGWAIGCVDNAAGPWTDDAHDLADMAALLYSVQEKRKRLAAVESNIETQLARAMDKNKVDVPGWELTRRGGSKIVWTSEAKATALGWAIEARFTDVNGELSEGFDMSTAYEVRDLVLELYGSSTINSTPLKDLGVDISEIVTREKSRRTVTVTPKVVES